MQINNLNIKDLQLIYELVEKEIKEIKLNDKRDFFQDWRLKKLTHIDFEIFALLDEELNKE